LAEINWTEEAQRWLKDIHDYIAADNPDAAVGTVRGIFRRAQILKAHPAAGHEYETQSSRQVRILLYGHYRITYLVKPNGDVDVLGVFHGALDIDRYLV
jgi:plasmid stabilization system protein ParE